MAGQLLPWIDSGDAEGNRNSMQNFLGDGVTTSWDFNFAGGYINVAHVKAYIYRSTSGLTEAIDPVVLTGPNTIQVIPAVPVGDYLVVYRDTPKDQPLVDYTTGAVLNEANLDMSNQQAVFATAEMADRFDAINASSADAIERSFQALTIANAADDKADSAITASTNAVNTANAANTTAAEALAIAEDAVAASTGFQTNLEFYTGDDVTSRGADWQTGSVAAPGIQRWFAGTDTASDFTIDRYNDAGVLQGSAVKLDRQTGEVTVAAKIHGVVDGTAPQDAATKAQLDAQLAAVDAQKIDKDGTLDFAAHQKLFDSSPTDPLHAASKGYVDGVADAGESFIINPCGVIQQETTAEATGYFADQWSCGAAGTGFTLVGSVANGDVSLHDPRTMYMRVTVAKTSLAAGDAGIMFQWIEGSNLRRLRYALSNPRGSWLRFRANATVGGTMSVSIRNAANTRSFVQTVGLTTTPTDYSIFIPGDTSGTWLTSGVGAASVAFCAGAGSGQITSTLGAWHAGNFLAGTGQSNYLATVNNQINITDVQWTPGNVLVPFVMPDIQSDLDRCLRYFQRISSDGINLQNQSSGTALMNIWLIAPMRAAAQLIRAPSGYVLENSLSSVSSILFDRANDRFVQVGIFGSGTAATGSSGRMVAGNGFDIGARM